MAKRHSLLSRRPYAYIVGVCVLSAATAIFLVGFVSPFWHLQKLGGSTKVHGLWLVCDKDSAGLTGCSETVFGTEGWLRGIQTLQILALLLLLVSCILAFLLNYARRLKHTHILEICSSFGATLALFGSFGYLLLTLTPRDADIVDYDLTYSWAFAMNAAGSIMAVIAAILIGVSNYFAPRGWETFSSRGDKAAPRPAITLPPIAWTGRGGPGRGCLQLYQPRKTMLAIGGPPMKGSLGDPRRRDMFRNPDMWLLPSHLHWVSNV